MLRQPKTLVYSLQRSRQYPTHAYLGPIIPQIQKSSMHLFSALACC
jgi:hypothetical protein